MGTPRVRLVFDRYKTASSIRDKGKKPRYGLVQVELYHDGKRHFSSTGVKLLKEQWDDARRVINHPEMAALNVRLNELMTRIQMDIVKQMGNGRFNIDDYNQNFVVEFDSGTALLDTVQEISDNYAMSGKSVSACKQYDVLLSRLKDFNARKDARSFLRKFEDGSIISVRDFELFLSGTMRLDEWTVWLYMSKLKHVFRYGVEMKYTVVDPFSDYKLRRPRNKDDIKYVTEQELQLLYAYTPVKRHEIYAYDMWMFMRWTGMSYVDASEITMDDVEYERGRYIVRGHRQKTGNRFSIVLLDPARKLLEKHGQFNKYTKSRVNIVLHDIGNAAIGRRMTTKMARHTYAVWALHNNVKIEVVSKMLGHSNINTTQIYAKVLAQDVIDEFDKLEKAINTPSESAE